LVRFTKRGETTPTPTIYLLFDLGEEKKDSGESMGTLTTDKKI